jgi:AraC-like DNA-binding protein
MNSRVQIEKAVRLLDENTSQTIAELANRCNLSVSRLSHLFRAHAGLSLRRFRYHRRFEQAKKMLTTTDMSIKEIAYLLGYRHSSSFVRAFEVSAGQSPSSYRKCELEKLPQQLGLTNSRRG